MYDRIPGLHSMDLRPDKQPRQLLDAYTACSFQTNPPIGAVLSIFEGTAADADPC